MCHKIWIVVDTTNNSIVGVESTTQRQAEEIASAHCKQTESITQVFELCSEFKMPEPTPIKHMAKSRPEINVDPIINV